MKRFYLLVACLLLALLSACGRVGKPHADDDDSDDFDIAEPSAEARRDVALLVNGNNEFALDLYRRQDSGNAFFSPLSVSVALAMVHAGARGETAAQMSRTLHFDLESDRLHAALSALQWDLHAQAEKDAIQLHFANAIWVDSRRDVQGEFQDLLKIRYGSRLRQVSFKDNSTAASEEINNWVKRQTHDKITDMVQPKDLEGDELTSATQFLLLNAVYFHGNWEKQFKERYTEEDTFHLDAEKKVQTMMMNATDRFSYGDSNSFQVLGMPYKGGDVSMYVFLPRPRFGLNELEKKLNAANLEGWIGKMHQQKVIVQMPRFKLQTRYDLSETLKQMGMSNAFAQGLPAAGGADFSGIDQKGDLFIGSVIHKAFVEVNEKGTEAAAVTKVSGKSSATSEDRPPVFRADQPFLFLIRDNLSGSILFIGRVMDPRG